ncbi:MAG: glycosyltransferase, partial [Planctomycetota bacterium]|nr:glycosyltransferase [Planctomycetota bacterium]
VLTDLKYQHGVQRYVAISRKIAAVLEQDGIEPDRIRVVHSGVPPLAEPLRSVSQVRDQLRLDNSTPLLGSVGALRQHKGHIHLVEAMAQLRDRQPRAQLVLIGDGKLDESLRNCARKLGIEERVHLVGFQEDVASWLAALDLYIHPSLEEGLGTSILDALSAGRTVIASDVGGIPEVIEDGVTGRLVAAANPTLLAEVIDQMLDNPNTAARLAEAGQQRATQQFSAEAMVEGNIRVHQELLDELQAGESSDEEITR